MEHPILFSTPMVRAILEGRKTQTRRVIRPQFSLLIASSGRRGDHYACYVSGIGHNGNYWKWLYCPHGAKGDSLWVKETFGICNHAISWSGAPHITDQQGVRHPVVHFADKDDYAWGMYGPPQKRPSLFMPKSAARIWLEITNVRVERVQEISAADCSAEGIAGKMDLRERFATIWDDINVRRGFGWNANPWVWVIEFKKTELRISQ